MIQSFALLVLFSIAGSAFARERYIFFFKPEIHRQQASSPTSKPANNVNELIGRLKARGQKVRRGSKVSQPFFSVRGRIISVDGEQVQVFQYANAKSADRDAKKIEPDGSAIGTSTPMWIALPHFFKSATIIVLYLGQSSSVVKALEGELGPQFAGKADQ